MNKHPIKSFKDLEVYQNSYKASLVIAERILPKLPPEEKYDIRNQLSRSSKSIPRLIAEGHAKKHQKAAFQKYLEDGIGEANETIVSLEHARDIYKIEIQLINDLVDLYDKIARQLFNLSKVWDKFRKRWNKPIYE